MTCVCPAANGRGDFNVIYHLVALHSSPVCRRSFHGSGLFSVPTCRSQFSGSSQRYSTSPSCPSWHQAFSGALPFISSPSYPTHSVSDSIRAFSSGVRSLHVCGACSLASFWVSWGERIFLPGLFDPHVHLSVSACLLITLPVCASS
jgi:hypothetical protein